MTSTVSARIAAFAETLADAPPVTLAMLAAGLGDAGQAAVMLLLGLPLLIPMPGVPLGLVFGITIGVLAVQVLRGQDVLHLPQMLARRSMPPAGLRRVLLRAVPWLRRLEGLLRPGRMGWLATGLGRRWAGAVLLLLAALLALPIPLGDPISALATVLIAVGLMEHDGGAVLAGMAVAVAALAWNVFILAAGWHLLDTALAHLL